MSPERSPPEIDEDRVAKAMLKLARPLRQLTTDLLADLPQEPELTEDEADRIEEARQRLAALLIPIPPADESGRKGYRWLQLLLCKIATHVRSTSVAYRGNRRSVGQLVQLPRRRNLK